MENGMMIKNKEKVYYFYIIAKGTYYYACGDRYEGDWKDNKRNGKGKFQ